MRSAGTAALLALSLVAGLVAVNADEPAPPAVVVDPTPRSKAEIRRAIKRLFAVDVGRAFTPAHADALRTLNVYRYLAGAPCEVVLDATQTRRAQAAAELMAELGELSHAPANPGWPAARFADAYEGASTSNLTYSGTGVQSAVVEETMHDTDNDNVWELGHRRANLAPYLQRTGFGGHGGYQAMGVLDASGPRDTVLAPFFAWPPAGLVPVAWWNRSKDTWAPAWSIHLNPAHYVLPPHECPTVRVWKVRKEPPTDPARFAAWRASLREEDRVSLFGTGRLEAATGWWAGLVWWPNAPVLAKGVRLWVEIEGLHAPGSEEPTSLRYYVEGFR